VGLVEGLAQPGTLEGFLSLARHAKRSCRSASSAEVLCGARSGDTVHVHRRVIGRGSSRTLHVARTPARKDDQLTLYPPDGAIQGLVVQYVETGLVADVDGEVPRDCRLRFILHLRQGMVSGEVISLGQDDRRCRLQFAALTDRDWALLAPHIEADA
jgi:hypothetical protein